MSYTGTVSDPWRIVCFDQRAGSNMAQGICSGSNAKQLFRSYRFILLLLSITFWACAAFYVQYYSRSTSHKGVNQAFLGHERMPKQDDRVNADKKEDDDHVNADKKEEEDRVNKAVSEEKKAVIDDRVNADKKEDDHVNADQKKEDDRVNKAVSEEKKAIIDDRVNADKKEDDHVNADQKKEDDRVNKAVSEEKKPVIPKDLIGELRRNSTAAGSIVGPFDSTEDRILEKRPTGSCDENGEFARVVRGRKFVVVLHELSMTGAPISMMELATELLLCEANVSVVVLNKKGGLMAELVRRKIKVVKDTKIVSFKTAVEADVVIPGTAVCASWIEQYRAYFPGSQSENIAWWIMENLRQYYEMSRYVLNRVKVLIFLTEPQSKEWLAWCKEDNIKLDSQEILVAPLSVNDELASVAGISSSSDTSSSSGPEVMLDKRKELRKLVREEMGLKDSDVVVMCLGSINTVKGQLLFLESAAQMMVEKELSSVANITEVVSDSKGVLQEQTLKILIGSLWSGSTAWRYLEAMLRIIYQHPNLSKLVLWTPTTTRVVALYSVADVYVTNSQTKFGETFGRVTIEAMAFGLPVLGTDAGGTANIVDHNKTGLLHPLGHEGNQVLAQNLQFLLENPIARQEMGARGREKVEKMYLKRHMLERLAGGISRCKTTI